MVSKLSIIFMVFSVLISIVAPIGGIIFLKKKYNTSLKIFFTGALAFFISVQLLEAPIHLYFLKLNGTTAEFLLNNPIAYMLYGGLMAGIFEETARLISFKFIIKDKDTLSGITYGVGHGGIEAILVGGISSINLIINSVLINKGTFQSTMESALVSSDVISTTYNQLVNSSAIMWAMPGIERIMAMAIQIALSIIVLYAVKERKYIYYIIAILLHALIDFPAALYQVGVIKNVFFVEGIIFIVTVLINIYVFKKIIRKFNINNEIL